MFKSHTVREEHLRNACRDAASKIYSYSKRPMALAKRNRHSMKRLAREVAKMQAPQFYVDQIYAYNVLSAYFAGRGLPGKGPVADKWEELAGYVTRRRWDYSDETLFDSVAYVLATQTASSFFMSESRIYNYIYNTTFNETD
ncbi:MAG: hypothetical protein NC343_03400 [Muribaculum sp.]|nr:hypothetical protein [Muribaculaceae bacterium]MCM1080773.1 hypothetical protein [Muribaculum sp.]